MQCALLELFVSLFVDDDAVAVAFAVAFAVRELGESVVNLEATIGCFDDRLVHGILDNGGSASIYLLG